MCVLSCCSFASISGISLSIRVQEWQCSLTGTTPIMSCRQTCIAPEIISKQIGHNLYAICDAFILLINIRSKFIISGISLSIRAQEWQCSLTGKTPIMSCRQTCIAPEIISKQIGHNLYPVCIILRTYNFTGVMKNVRYIGQTTLMIYDV